MTLTFKKNGATVGGPWSFSPATQGQSQSFSASVASATATCTVAPDSGQQNGAIRVVVSATDPFRIASYSLVYVSAVDGSTITVTDTYDPPASQEGFTILNEQCSGSLTIYFSQSSSSGLILRHPSSGTILRHPSSASILRDA